MRSSTGSIVDRVPAVGDTASRIVQQPRTLEQGLSARDTGNMCACPFGNRPACDWAKERAGTH